jgi:DNA-binding MltR family transcriptional regulator
MAATNVGGPDMSEIADSNSDAVIRALFSAELSRVQQEALIVLTSAALLDRELMKLLLTRMRTLSDNRAKRIFEGPLGRFAAKVDVAYAFELIDDELHQDLTVIRNIRNEFAHSVTDISFASPEVMNHMRGFKGWNTDVLNQFDFFNVRVQSCLKQLNAKQEAGIMAYAVRGS